MMAFCSPRQFDLHSNSGTQRHFTWNAVALVLLGPPVPSISSDDHPRIRIGFAVLSAGLRILNLSSTCSGFGPYSNQPHRRKPVRCRDRRLKHYRPDITQSPAVLARAKNAYTRYIASWSLRECSHVHNFGTGNVVAMMSTVAIVLPTAAAIVLMLLRLLYYLC